MDRFYEFYSKHVFPSDPATGTLGSIVYNVSLMQLGGIPLLGAKKESKRFKLWFSIYAISIMIIMLFIYTGLELYDLVSIWRDLDALTQNTCLTFNHLVGIVKVVNALYRRKDVIRIIDQLRFLNKKYVISDKQRQAFYWGEFENKITLMVYSSMVIFTATLGMLMIVHNPTNIAGKIFPYRVRMPEFLPYTVQLVYMSLAVIILAVQVVSVDYLNITMLNQTRNQMKILNIAFDKLTVTANIDIDPRMYLNMLIKHHNFIITIRNEIEDVFKYPLLLQFLTSMIIIAMTGFQATVPSDSSGAILIYFYCVCIFSELFVYCWFGNEVSEQNKTLASYGYNSLWYNFDERYKKSLVIFLMNAQMPFSYTAGGFIELSLQTFTGVLSKSYTYIAVLRQIYSE